MGIVIAIAIGVVVTVLTTEAMGWMPRASVALVRLAVRRFLSAHPEQGEEAHAITREWEREVLSDLAQYEARPLFGFFFALAALATARRSAIEYFGLPERNGLESADRSLRRSCLRVLDRVVYLVVAIALAPGVLVAAVITLIAIPPFLVLVGIMHATGGADWSAQVAAGLEPEEPAEDDESITADSTLADLAPADPATDVTASEPG